MEVGKEQKPTMEVECSLEERDGATMAWGRGRASDQGHSWVACNNKVTEWMQTLSPWPGRSSSGRLSMALSGSIGAVKAQFLQLGLESRAFAHRHGHFSQPLWRPVGAHIRAAVPTQLQAEPTIAVSRDA